jgi:sentrin-specific protease 1
MDKVIIPIHLGNHWCLAVINLAARRFEYYDSLGSPNPSCLQTLRRYLQDEALDKKQLHLDLSGWEDYQPHDIPLQRNGYDCGVFMCQYANYLSIEQEFTFTQDHMPIIRQLMVLEILQKSVDPPYSWTRSK